MASLKCFDRPTSADIALQRLNFIIALDRARDRDDRRAVMFHSGGMAKGAARPIYGPTCSFVGIDEAAEMTLEAFDNLRDAITGKPAQAAAPKRSRRGGDRALGTRTLTVKLSDARIPADSPTARAIARMVQKPPRFTQTNPAPILQILLEQEHRMVTSRIQRLRTKPHPVFSPEHVRIYDLEKLAAELERSTQELANRSPQDYGRVGESDPAIRLNLTGEQWSLLSRALIHRLEAFQPHDSTGDPNPPPYF